MVIARALIVRLIQNASLGKRYYLACHMLEDSSLFLIINATILIRIEISY
jgi:hypothetical protein